MNLSSDEGIILRRSKHLDADTRLVAWLKNHGKINMIIKGGLKLESKLKVLQEPFTEGDFHFFIPPHGVNSRLTGGQLLNSHLPLRQNLQRFELASKCCEVVDLLFPYRGICVEAYEIFKGALHQLETAESARWVWIHYLRQMIKVLGHGDLTSELLEELLPAERPGFANGQGGVASAYSVMSLERCSRIVESRLEQLLPWRLKSDIFKAV